MVVATDGTPSSRAALEGLARRPESTTPLGEREPAS
jgi:hypothetical protein